MRQSGISCADALERIGHQKGAAVSNTVGSPRQYGWRAAVDLAFDTDGTDARVGFYTLRGSEIVPITGCPVAADGINARIARLAEAIAAAGIGKAGEIRLVAGIDNRVAGNLILKRSATESRRQAERLCREAGLSGLEVTTPRGVWSVGDPVVAYPGWDGAGQAGLFCRPSGFVQANPDVNRELINRLISFDLAGKNVLELYCGIGNLTVPMAAARARVTGVEASRTSVEDAGKTVEAMGLTDAKFMTGKVDAVLSDRSISQMQWDVIVLDPPRTGARAVVERISEFHGRRDHLYLMLAPDAGAGPLGPDRTGLAARFGRADGYVPPDVSRRDALPVDKRDRPAGRQFTGRSRPCGYGTCRSINCAEITCWGSTGSSMRSGTSLRSESEGTAPTPRPNDGSGSSARFTAATKNRSPR